MRRRAREQAELNQGLFRFSRRERKCVWHFGAAADRTCGRTSLISRGMIIASVEGVSLSVQNALPR